MATGFLITSLLATAVQVKESADQASLAREGVKVRSAEEKSQTIAQKRREFRQKRVRDAAVRSASQATGVSGSSGESGALSVLGTNAATSSAGLSRQIGTANALGNLAQKQADSQFKSQIAGAVGSISNSLFSASMSNPETAKKFNNIFSKQET